MAVRSSASAAAAAAAALVSRGSLLDAAHALRTARVSSEQLARACLDRIAVVQPQCNAFISLATEDSVMAAARAADARRAKGAALGVLDGIPIAVKDNLCTAGLRTTAASRMLADYVPPFDAAAVERLRLAGAVLLGKTNMDEFGMGSAGTHSHFGAVVNPLGGGAGGGAARVAGGSSSGSAAAVAARCCFAALGSDTGGSVRLPAAYCGVVGLKPTYGLLSRLGLIAYGSSLDCVGVLARTVDDAAAVLAALTGHDARDSTSLPDAVTAELRAALAAAAVPPATAAAPGDLRGVRVGLPEEYNVAELSVAARDAWLRGAERLERAGATVRTVSLPSTALALPAYYVLASAEASSNLARYDGLRFGFSAATAPAHLLSAAAAAAAAATGGSDASSAPVPAPPVTAAGAAELAARVPLEAVGLAELVTLNRSGGFGGEVQRRLFAGTFALGSDAYAAYVEQAMRARRRVAEEMLALFAAERLDALLTPTAPSAAPSLEQLARAPPLRAYLADALTVPASLAGLPAFSVPAQATGGGGEEEEEEARMPLGLQLVGPPLHEDRLLRIARVLEQP